MGYTKIETILVALIGTSLIAYFVLVWYEWRRLSHVPGPLWAGFTKLWMVYQSQQRRQPHAFKEANDRYGPLVRVGPNEVITNDPNVLRKVMAVRSEYTRGNFHKAFKFDPTRDNLFSMRDEAAHTKLRAKMAAGYSGKENTSMEGVVDERVASFINLIEDKYLSTAKEFRPVDLGEKTSFFTMDVITDLAFGQPFGNLDTDSDVYDYLKITKSSLPIMTGLSDVPEVAVILQSRIFRKLLPSEADKTGFGAFIGVAKRLVAERYSPNAESKFDMLGSFKRHGLTQEEVAGEALLQIAAGLETTAANIRTVMLNVLTNPSVYRKLQTEIDHGIASGRISSPITDAEARNMPYLQAIIKEGLRIMPPASGALFKQVPPAGDVIAGKFLPGGTQIGFSPLGTQYSKDTYGTDADLFRPERWIEASLEKAQEMTSTVDLCFHYGKYHCLGKPVAWMEFNKFFVEIFRRFDFSACRPDRPATLSNAGMWVMEDFWVRIERRGTAL
ncbi:uncharacterized protein EKO05_0010836 [Ascochyta rabiei]|nr:uncharacterized protein EKO05_0010836 [Ascochyta rabiei]UPX20608.1 hypothetical protein EKO05_0010836 [Ascochyta rabiei]